jgi:tight adherence protein B
MEMIILVAVAAAFALLILGFGIYTMRRDRQAVIDERLGRYTSEYQSQLTELLEIENETNQSSLRDSARDVADKALENSAFAKKWKIQLAKADLKITPAEFLGAHFVTTGIGFFIGMFILGGPIAGVMAAVAGFFTPRIYVSRKTQTRLQNFEDQLPDNLQMWVNGLRSGYSVLQAIESISKEAAEPTQSEFKRVVREVQLGIPLDEALDHLLERMPSDDLDLVITAVNIQREVGGNLAEILDIISHTIRERIKLKGEIRVLTAQGRVTGYIIGGLPIVLFLFLMVINPDYVGLLIENRMCGWPMIGCGGAMIAMGIAAIQKIVDIQI